MGIACQINLRIHYFTKEHWDIATLFHSLFTYPNTQIPAVRLDGRSFFKYRVYKVIILQGGLLNRYRCNGDVRSYLTFDIRFRFRERRRNELRGVRNLVFRELNDTPSDYNRIKNIQKTIPPTSIGL